MHREGCSELDAVLDQLETKDDAWPCPEHSDAGSYARFEFRFQSVVLTKRHAALLVASNTACVISGFDFQV